MAPPPPPPSAAAACSLCGSPLPPSVEARALHKAACAPSLPESENAKVLAALFKRSFHLSYLPRLERGKTNVAKYTSELAVRYPGEFCLSLSFDKHWIAELMYHGYLPMSDCDTSSPTRIYFLLPKLHTERCLVDFANVPAPHKSVVKRSNKYKISVDVAFLQVCAGIVREHGENWFYPRLVKAFCEMNQSERLFNGKVGVHSFELWQDEELVAGEVGYTVGATYTSLSGFVDQRDGSGTVQMFAMAQILKSCGFVMWDLGMALPYKTDVFGGQLVARVEFLARLATLRDVGTEPLPRGRMIEAKLSR